MIEAAAESGGHPTKKMFHIEKFLPTGCPKCKHAFESERTDWSRLLGDIVDGEKVIRQTKGYDIIICAHCQNYTARFPLETYTIASREQAEEFMAKEGFVNLQVVTCSGTHTQGMHAKNDIKPIESATNFFPPECPKCRSAFAEATDFSRGSDVGDGSTVVCAKCGNQTAIGGDSGVRVMSVKCDGSEDE